MRNTAFSGVAPYCLKRICTSLASLSLAFCALAFLNTGPWSSAGSRNTRFARAIRRQSNRLHLSVGRFTGSCLAR